MQQPEHTACERVSVCVCVSQTLLLSENVVVFWRHLSNYCPYLRGNSLDQLKELEGIE